MATTLAGLTPTGETCGRGGLGIQPNGAAASCKAELVLHGLAADLRSKPSHIRRRVWWILRCRTDSHGFEVCQQKPMVPSTAGMGVETAVESQLSEVGNEGDLWTGGIRERQLTGSDDARRCSRLTVNPALRIG
jgi:hypothetical protein